MLGFQWDAVLSRWSRKVPFWPPWPYCSVQGPGPCCTSQCFSEILLCFSEMLPVFLLQDTSSTFYSCCVVLLQNASQYSSRLFLLLVLSGLTQVILFFSFPSLLSPVFYWISPADSCCPCACNSVQSTLTHDKIAVNVWLSSTLFLHVLRRLL